MHTLTLHIALHIVDCSAQRLILFLLRIATQSRAKQTTGGIEQVDW